MGKNLGLIKAIHVGTVAPSNTNMLWFDSNASVKKHKYYDDDLSDWVLLASSGSPTEYRAGRIVCNSIETKVISFSSNLGSVDTNVVVLCGLYTSNGDYVAVVPTGITKSGFSVSIVQTGTLYYQAFIKK